MKKIHVILLLVSIVIVAMQGCRQTTNKQNWDGSLCVPVNKDSLFLVEDSAENLISIQMPNDPRISDAQRELIHEFLLTKINEDFGEKFSLVESTNDLSDKSRPYTNCYIGAQSRIECYSETVVSVVVEGLYNKRNAAHPIDFLWALNYNPETLEIVNFTERYQLDAKLYREFSEIAQSDIMASCEGKWPAGWGDFAEVICSEDRFLKGLSPKGSFNYYFTENGVVVSVPSSYVIKNHIEVFLPYNVLTAVD